MSDDLEAIVEGAMVEVARMKERPKGRPNMARPPTPGQLVRFRERLLRSRTWLAREDGWLAHRAVVLHVRLLARYPREAGLALTAESSDDEAKRELAAIDLGVFEARMAHHARFLAGRADRSRSFAAPELERLRIKRKLVAMKGWTPTEL